MEKLNEPVGDKLRLRFANQGIKYISYALVLTLVTAESRTFALSCKLAFD